MNERMGHQSIRFGEPVYIRSGASVAGKKEGEGPLGPCFDEIEKDPLAGEKTWEQAESALQHRAALRALDKAQIKNTDLRMIFAGDLLAQCTASSYNLAQLDVPVYGLFGACSTMGEALSLASMAVAGDFAEYAMALTSSHFASAEKEFRFPLAYGNQRPLSATWTVTGSGACVLSKEKSRAAVTGVTTGKIVDFGLKDSMNMGACMAPAACDTICTNLQDFGRHPDEYDRIITGDLGSVGQHILFDLLEKQGYDIKRQHLDCGMLIFDDAVQDTHAGGSGCGCSAVVFASYILPRIISGEWKRVLFVPTGALMSKVSFAEGQTVPGIAQAVVVEHMEEKD